MPMIVFISLYQHSIVEIKHNIHYILRTVTSSYIINLISKHEKSIRGGDVRERISSLYLSVLAHILPPPIPPRTPTPRSTSTPPPARCN